MPSASILVAIVADDALVASGLTALLEAREELALVAEVDGADVVLLDPGPAPAPEQLGELGEVVVVALAADAEAACRLERAGVAGVVRRGADPATLAAALAAVARGLAVRDPALADPDAEAGAGEPALATRPDSGPDPLTARELEVLALLAGGLSNKQIARRLDVSEHTAKFHVNSILGKLGASSRTQAVVTAARRGLLVL